MERCELTHILKQWLDDNKYRVFQNLGALAENVISWCVFDTWMNDHSKIMHRIEAKRCVNIWGLFFFGYLIFETLQGIHGLQFELVEKPRENSEMLDEC